MEAAAEPLREYRKLEAELAEAAAEAAKAHYSSEETLIAYEQALLEPLTGTDRSSSKMVVGKREKLLKGILSIAELMKTRAGCVAEEYATMEKEVDARRSLKFKVQSSLILILILTLTLTLTLTLIGRN